MEKVALLIPCLNEENAIGRVIKNIYRKTPHRNGFVVEMIVIDNNSTDRTAEVARSLGVKVVTERKRGKGHALRAGLQAIPDDAKYVAVIDGDNTYKPYEVFRLLEPLQSNFCDMSLGSRIGGKILRGSLSSSHRIVNWMFSFMVRHFYQANVTDVLTGFFAMKRELVEVLLPHLKSDDFTIEMELVTKVARSNFIIFSMPITYDVRIGRSKLDSLKDGLKIVKTLFVNLFWKLKQAKQLKKSLKYENSLSI